MFLTTASVAVIENYAFQDCSNLKTLYFQGNAPTVGTDAFRYSGIVIAYYRSGKTGWAPMLGNCLTSLWTPDVPCGYEVDSGTIMITKYLGSAREVTIPTSIDGLPVTTIGTNSFDGCASITNVIVPGAITSIRDHAFSSCRSLIGVIIPSSVTNIG